METNETDKREFEDIKIPVNIKLSALWTSLMFCYVYGDYFSFYVPGQIGAFLNGVTLLNSPAKLFAASILLVIPGLMIFLSIVLKASVNRLLNIFFGFVYTIVMLLVGITSLAPWWTFYVFLALVEIILTLLIVWHAWTWPRQTIIKQKNDL